MKLALSIVIPAKDEAAALPGLLRDLKAAGLPRSREVIVVDDGSNDETAALARAGGARVISTAGLGYGGALRAGFKAARGEWIAFLDADGTYPAATVTALWRARPLQPAMLLADRFAPVNHMPYLRRIGNRVFSWLAQQRLRRPVPDLCSGQRLFHRRLIALTGPLPKGLHFSPAFTFAAARAGFDLKWIKTSYFSRMGSSKLNVFGDGWLFLREILKG